MGVKAKKVLLAAVAVLAPLFLIVIGILHLLWHERYALDWPTVTLLITGVVLLFLPVREIAAKLLKLKVGGLEIELRKETEALTAKVDEAEIEATSQMLLAAPISKLERPAVGPDVVPQVRIRIRENANHRTSVSGRLAGTDGPEATLSQQVDDLTRVSPSAGLVRIATALEEMTIGMALPYKSEKMPRILTFLEAVTVLVRAEKISPALAEALSDFRRVRNQVVHHHSTVDQSIIKSAVTEGKRLYNLLHTVSSIQMNRQQMIAKQP